MARSSSRAKPFAVSTSPVAELPAVTLPVALTLPDTLCSSVREMDAVFPASRISDHIVAVTNRVSKPAGQHRRRHRSVSLVRRRRIIHRIEKL